MLKILLMISWIMNSIKKFLLLYILLAYMSYASDNFNIKINGVRENKINEKGLIYKITAQTKDLKFDKIKKNFFFFNKEEVISNSIYYTNGYFETKDLKIDFKKAYFLEGNFIMINTLGKYKDQEFKSFKSIFKYTRLDLENVFITIERKKYKKLKYTFLIKP